jgi:O-antigen ligase
MNPVDSLLLVALTVACAACFMLLSLRYFNLLLACLLITAANLGMVSNKIAIKMSTGQNLFEIRDVVIITMILLGALRGHRHLLAAARSPVIWPGLGIVVLVPIAASVGFMRGGIPIVIAREAYVLGLWGLAWIIAANSWDIRAVERAAGLVVVTGVLVGIGAAIEVFTGNAVQLVSSIQASLTSTLARALPDGAVALLIAAVFCYVSFITYEAPRTWRCFILAVVFLVLCVAVLVSQMRGVAISLAGAMLVFHIASWIGGRGAEYLVRGTAIVTLFAVTALVAYFLVRETAGQRRAEFAVERHAAVFGDRSTQGRRYEVEAAIRAWESSPVLGKGLGVPYRAALPGSFGLSVERDSRTDVHNSLAYLVLKLGLPGLALFLAFAVNVFRTLLLYVRLRDAGRVTGIGLPLATAIVSLLILSMAGTVFGTVLGMPITVVAVGLLASHLGLINKGGGRLSPRAGLPCGGGFANGRVSVLWRKAAASGPLGGSRESRGILTPVPVRCSRGV